MYKEYFGLQELPFSIAPDPRYLYMSEQHREALAHLIYGFNGDGGFVLLTGEVGAGKTTVCRCLLEQIPENIDIAFILNPKLSVQELLATICDEFRIKYPADNVSVKVYVDLINTYLLDAHSRGRQAVLLIDEAQNLDPDILEQLRLLTNLETNQQKLLQIILIGQPELRDKLSKPELLQLSQRVTARYHLGSLSKKEVGNYVKHRLSVAGLRYPLFPDSAVKELYRQSRGVPRIINVICDRALLGAYVQKKDKVKKSILKKAAAEVFGGARHSFPLKKARTWSLVILAVIAVGAVFAASYYKQIRVIETDTFVEIPDVESMEEESLQEESLIEEPLKEEPYFATPVKESIDELPQMTYAVQWPDDQPLTKSRGMAFQSLYSQWNLTYGPEKNPDACAYAQTKGLQCYQKSGSVASLILFNRPAVLRLFNIHGLNFYVTITAVKGDSAILVVGKESVRISLEDVESQWGGDYTLLWKTPHYYKGSIEPGKRNLLIPWLDRQLAFVQNRKRKIRANIRYDEELVSHVKKFQRAEGLLPDGIIGPQTLMRLNTALGTKSPTLKGEKSNSNDKKDS